MKQTATYGIWLVNRNDDGKVEIFKNGQLVDNNSAAFREIAAELGIEIDPEWRGSQLRAAVMKAMQNAEDPEPKKEESTKETRSQSSLEDIDIECMNLEQLLRASKEWDLNVFNKKLDSLTNELYNINYYNDEARAKLLERSKSKKSQIDLMYYGWMCWQGGSSEDKEKGSEILKQLVDKGFLPAAYRLAEYHYRVYRDKGTAINLAYAIGWLSIYLQYERNGGVVLDAYLRRAENQGHAEDLFQKYVKEIEGQYKYIVSLLGVFFDAEKTGKEIDTLNLWSKNDGKEWPATYLDANKLKLLLNKYLELQQNGQKKYEELLQKYHDLEKAKESAEYWRQYNKERFDYFADYSRRLEEKNQALEEKIKTLKSQLASLSSSSSSSRSSSDDKVKVEIKYMSKIKGIPFSKRKVVTMTNAEYKSLRDGSMKARIAYVTNNCGVISLVETVSDVSVSLA